MNTLESQPWVARELSLRTPVRLGDRGDAVKKVQEWLTLHGFATKVDGDFGPATKRAVEQFQAKTSLTVFGGVKVSGEVSEVTWKFLVDPLRQAISTKHLAGLDFESAFEYAAQIHLGLNPREVGGQNSGPWVRLYMKGNQGTQWPWCAGFVSFLMLQAQTGSGHRAPLKYAYSCDLMTQDAKQKGLFVPEADLVKDPSLLKDTGIFMVRRTSSDWIHTGVVTSVKNGAFTTIEGNTNDEGSREGYEVCKRVRAIRGNDFIRLVK